MGQYTSNLDLILFLGLITGAFYSFVVNPVLKTWFNVGWHRPYAGSTFAQRFVIRVKDTTIAVVTVVAVSGVYRVINTTAIKVLELPEDQIFLPGEPFLFGLFYTIVNTTIVWFFMRGVRIVPSRRKA